MRRNILLILIIFGALAIRLINISTTPPAISIDELNVILNTKSLLATGRPIPGVQAGFIASIYSGGWMLIYSELTTYFLMPWVAIFGLTWPLIKIPFVVVSVTQVLFIYLIAKKLTNKEIGLISALIMAINPWSILTGRAAYETTVSHLFITIGIYFLLVLNTKKRLLALIPLAIGFLTYYATKPILAPLVALTFTANALFAKAAEKKSELKIVLIATSFAIAFTLLFSLWLKSQPGGTRFTEFSLYNHQDVLEKVNTNRRMSLGPTLFTNIFENKVLEDIKIRTDAVLQNLNPVFLFLKGHEGGAEAFTLPDHGPMYLIDSLFIIIGIAALSRFYPKALVVVLAVCLASLVPNAVSLQGRNYIMRAGLLYPFLVILSSSGVWLLINLFNSTAAKRTMTIIIAGAYFLSFLYFSHAYFSLMPIAKNEGWYFHQRLMANYISRINESNPNQKIFLGSHMATEDAFIYLFFNNLYQTKNVEAINKKLLVYPMQFDNLTINNKCPEIYDKDTVYIIDPRMGCKLQKEDAVIESPKDSGAKYKIIKEVLCTGVTLSSYSRLNSINDFDLSSLSNNRFCELWINRY